jgi:hypothetical protein
MEVKPRDVLHFTSSTTKWNGFFLVVEITPSFMKVRNPKEEFVIPIKDGKVDDIDVVVVHSATIPGFAETRGFLPTKKIRIDFTFQADVYGIIQSLENDMIEVLLSDGTTIYIDFEYKGPPDSIISIVVDELQIDYEDIDVFVAESQSRFTLERQTNDLMEHLLTNQSAKKKREVNQLIQRFKDLRRLHSTPNLEPKWTHTKTYPWVFPIISVTRKLVEDEKDTLEWVKSLIGLQENNSISYLQAYKQILQEFQPFYNGTGKPDSTLAFISTGKVCIRSANKKDAFKIVKRTHIPQMINEPLLHTQPELIHPVNYLIFPPEYYQYKSHQLPLFHKVPYQSIVPYMTHSNVTSVSTVPVTLTLGTHYSIYSYLQYLGPYDIQRNTLSKKELRMIKDKVSHSISQYHSVTYNKYTRIPLPESSSMKEACLHAMQEAMKFQLNESHSVDKVIETQPVSPPVVKIYESIQALKADKGIVFYDKEFDTTNYDEMDAYTTLEEMMRYLIKVKRMIPSVASLYAPFFLEQKKRVVNGEYAKVGKQYYKRVQDEWRLDETCNGPYPCTTDEPDCEPNCPDLKFRLKQNTIHDMIQDIKINHYTNQLERNKYLEQKYATLKRELDSTFKDIHSQKRVPPAALIYVDTSPYFFMLPFILQKPEQERFKDLKKFIQQYTRSASPEEDPLWYYCDESNLKLIPCIFDVLIEAYEANTYQETLVVLQNQGDIQVQGDSLVTLVGGFFVAPLHASDGFDDAVRSAEINEFFLDLPREVHPNTQLIVELLNETSALIKVNVTKYFNYMIHELVSEPEVVCKSIAFVIKVASMLYDTAIEDKIRKVLDHESRYHAILARYKIKEDISYTKIVQDIKSVSSKYGVQMIKPKSTVAPIKSSVWHTFLPPLEVKNTPSFRIMYDLQERIKNVEPMENTKVSSWKGNFNLKIPPYKRDFKQYTKSKPFLFEMDTPSTMDAHVSVIGQVVTPVLKQPLPDKFELLLPRLKAQVRTWLNVQFIPPNIPLFYLRSFIQNLGQTYPSFLLHTISFQQIPLSLPFLSSSHKQKLKDLMDKQILVELRKFDPTNLGLDKVLSDPDILAIMEALKLPCVNRIEYEYYIFVIFNKYVEYGTDDSTRTQKLILFYIQSFLKEYHGISLSYDVIQRETLKDRASEADERRVNFNAMDAETKDTTVMLENFNLTKKAQLGRIRTYVDERYEGNEFHTRDMDLPDIDEPDFGTDGNDDENYDDE